MNHSRQLLVIASSAVFWVASAQIVTDGSMGQVESFRETLLTIDASFGRTVGPNLFHSFETFNIPADQRVIFTGSDQITRVISRVTGGEISKIEGTLESAIPEADFYLLNPAGIVFGKDAVVNVGGSFVATTADRLTMADGTQFQARLGGDDVLTVAPPSSFGFLTPDNPRTDEGAIRMDGSDALSKPGGRFGMDSDEGFSVKAVKGFDVVARSIDISGESILNVPEGSLRLIAVGGDGELPVESLETSGFKQMGDIRIRDDSQIHIGSVGGGRLLVRAGNMTSYASDSGFFEWPTILVENVDSPDVGDSAMEIRETLMFEGGGIRLESNDGSRSSKFTLRAEEMTLNNSWIVSSATGTSAGPDLEILVQRMKLQDGGSIQAQSTEERVETPGAAGSVLIRGDVFHLESGTVASLSGGVGQGGDVVIDVTQFHLGGTGELAELNVGPSLLNEAPNPGPAGDISIRAHEFTMSGGALIDTMQSDVGTSGSVTIQADTVRILDDAVIDTSTTDLGASGSIEIRAKTLHMENSVLTTSAWGEFSGGDISLFIEGDAFIADSSIDSSAAWFGLEQSQGGTIRIKVGGRVDIMGESFITADSSGSSKAGDILIESDTLQLGRSDDLTGPFISSGTDGFSDSGLIRDGGKAGKITLTANRIEMNHAFLVSDTSSSGDGGEVSVTARDFVSRDTQIRASSDDDGRSGNIHICCGNIALLQESFVTTDSSGSMDGGSVRIDASELLITQGSMVTTSSLGPGNGGTIHLDAGRLELDGEDVMVTAESLAMEGASGNAGSVFITGGQVRVVRGATVSSESFLSNAGSVSVIGVNRLQAEEARFIVTSDFADAGKITMASEGLLLIKDTGVEAVAKLDGGDIQMTGLAVGLSNAHLLANAEVGNGGAIQITTDLYLNRGLNRIEFDTQNQSARTGSFRLNTTWDLVGGLKALDGEMTTEDMEVRDGCLRRNPRANSLLVRGKGGIPTSAAGLFPAVFLLTP